MSRPALLGLALAGLVAGCAPNRGAAYERAVAAAHRATNAGRFDVAADRFDDAARTARVPRDGLQARYEAALARARTGDIARAARELRALADVPPPNELAAPAALQAAALTARSDPRAGAAELEAMAVRFPASGSARVALDRVLRFEEGEPALGETPDPAAAARSLARLDALLPRIVDTELEEHARYQRARRLADAGRLEEARTALLDVAHRWPYPKGAYFDDALFRASELESRLGRPAAAAEHLERLLSFHETSTMIGSYERPRYMPAALRLARLYEVDLHDRERAKATLHRLYAEFPTSTLRDDALWREAELWRADGDEPTACARLATLVSELPDSRYVPCVTARCPRVARPGKSRAPATCHAYLTRGAPATPAGEEVAPTVDTGRPDDPR